MNITYSPARFHTFESEVFRHIISTLRCSSTAFEKKHVVRACHF